MNINFDLNEIEKIKDVLLEISVAFEYYKDEIADQDVLTMYLDSYYVKNVISQSGNDRLFKESKRIFDLVEEEVNTRFIRKRNFKKTKNQPMD